MPPHSHFILHVQTKIMSLVVAPRATSHVKQRRDFQAIRNDMKCAAVQTKPCVALHVPKINNPALSGPSLFSKATQMPPTMVASPSKLIQRPKIFASALVPDYALLRRICTIVREAPAAVMTTIWFGRLQVGRWSYGMKRDPTRKPRRQK